MSSTRSIIAPPPFAEDALTVIPPTPVAGVSYRDEAAGPASSPDGWPYAERVNSAEFNQIMYQLSSLVSIMDNKGVLGWSSAVDYPDAGVQFGSDGVLYRWLQASGPTLGGAKDPVSEPTFWEPAGKGQLISSQVVSASGTLNAPAGFAIARFRLSGGGGGSGVVVSTNASQVSAVGGGASGSYLEGWLTAAQFGASQTVTIGAAGPGGTAGSGGGAGGPSSVGTLLTAPGGLGSPASIVVATTSTDVSVGGMPGAVATGGTVLNETGMQGDYGIAILSKTLGGRGGFNPMGSPGQAAGSTFTPTSGTGFGSGGGGWANGVSTVAKVGIAGLPGGLIVDWYR